MHIYNMHICQFSLQPPDDMTRSLVLALGVCYHACLEHRQEYREAVADTFVPPLQLENAAQVMLEEISR